MDDLIQFSRTAERIVERGRAAFFDPDDDIVRRAGRSVIVDVSAAADRLPEEFRARFSDVPWRNIRDTRSYVAHQYEAVRDDLIWETLQNQLPDLVARLTGRR
ncbi:MAG: HepT-like ribonuclease domain-containing protein [Jiangellaceae bacterium]